LLRDQESVPGGLSCIVEEGADFADKWYRQVFREGAVQDCVNFTANCVGGASRAQAVTVLVAVGVFEVVAVRWDSSMALCANPKEAHGVQG